MLKDMMDQIMNLGREINGKARRLATAANDPNVSIADLEREQQELSDMQTRLNALQRAYDTAAAGHAEQVTDPAPLDQQQPARTRNDILKSREYVRAFTNALKKGLTPRNSAGNPEAKILFDAMTEGGGSPAGSDGGFLVPEEMDFTIRELRRSLNPLADYFSVETVTAPTGWRIVDTAPTTGMTLVDEMGTVPQDDQPSFRRVTYTVSKYGLIIPISNELLNDEAANLMAYLSRWFAKKQILQENALLLAAMKQLTATALGDGLTGLKAVLNKVLDPAISQTASIIVNQDAFNYLDTLIDTTGRGLLQPDPTNSTQYRILGRPCHVVSNAVMPSITTGSGSSQKTNAQMYIGDGREYATLFVRQGFEVTSTDVGGNAFRTDSTEVRGLVRMGVTVFDNAAMARRQVEV